MYSSGIKWVCIKLINLGSSCTFLNERWIKGRSYKIGNLGDRNKCVIK